MYVSIDELPNPRDWGTVDFSVGAKLIFRRDVDLAAPTFEEIEGLIGQHWEKIQASGYQRIAYDNVTGWGPNKLEGKLGRGGLFDLVLLT